MANVGFDFGEAWKYLKKGKAVRLPIWDKGIFIVLRKCVNGEDGKLRIFPTGSKDGTNKLFVCSGEQMNEAKSIDMNNLLATNWEIYEFPKIEVASK